MNTGPNVYSNALDLKINKANLLFKKGEISKSISLYNNLCLSNLIPLDDKIKIIISFTTIMPLEAYDMITRWRDLLSFKKDKELEENVELLKKISECFLIDSIRRIECAVSLYNGCFLNICYKAFNSIAIDEIVIPQHRIEATKYLFASQEDNYRKTAEETLLKITNSESLPSEFRYKTIASFNSKTGIATLMNWSKLKVAYNEKFLYTLQNAFFNNTDNDVKDRILSGQNLIQMGSVKQDEKDKIIEILLAFGKREDLNENTRADATDVVLRLGTPEQITIARQLISELGRSGLSGNKVKTIYNDSQNVHEFSDQAEAFIERIIKENTGEIRSYSDVHQEAVNKSKFFIDEKEGRDAVLRALHRISVDTATFTSYKATISDIFVYVWDRVQKLREQFGDEPEKRLIEELVDMKDTCSSGHCNRFINALSEFDGNFTISWDAQIIANLSGRMQAKIRDCSDEELKYKLALADSELADEDDKEAYKTFIEDNLITIKKELKEEFVGEGHVKEDIFERAFKRGAEEWGIL